jgi:hypothetical protein
MLFDLRCYTFRPGTVARHLQKLAAHELPILERYLTLRGCWTSDSGVLNRVYQLFQYRDLQDSIDRRAALYGDAAFQEVVASSGTYAHLVRQESDLLRLLFEFDGGGEVVPPNQMLALWTIEIAAHELAAVADHLRGNGALRAAWQSVTGRLGRLRLLTAPMLGDDAAIEALLAMARTADCELLRPAGL